MINAWLRFCCRIGWHRWGQWSEPYKRRTTYIETGAWYEENLQRHKCTYCNIVRFREL